MADIRGHSDSTLEAIATVLAPYEKAHANARIVLYRQNSVSVRIRIIDPDFEGTVRFDRHDLVWNLLEELSDDDLSQVTVLLLLAPEEIETSYANVEFDHPVASSL